MSGYKVVLTADGSLTTEFRGIVLFGFITCAPKEYIPELLYSKLFAPPVESQPNGGAKFAQYGLRKVEAALLENGFDRNEIIVAHPHRLDDVIGDETEVVGINTMDPLGIGPVTTSFSLGDNNPTPYNRAKFIEIMNKLSQMSGDFKTVIGGPGAWQFKDKDEREKYGIDHVFAGECEADVAELFQQLINGEEIEDYLKMRPPSIDEIPIIRGASINSLVEVMRGCGRMCRFCDPGLRKSHDIPVDMIEEEVKVNRDAGKDSAWLHSEDFLLYGRNNRNYYPDEDAVLTLFKEVAEIDGINEIGGTHCSLSAVAADPELVEELSKILNASSDHWLGVQPGIETGSPSLLSEHAANKAKPFTPKEWPEVVKKAIDVLNDNYWHPACTLMLGMPGETEEDVRMTLDLVKELGNKSCVLAPLFYVPLGQKQEGGYCDPEDLTMEQFELLYRCWCHNIKQFNEGVWMATEGKGILMKLIISAIVKFGSSAILKGLKDCGKKKYGRKFIGHLQNH